MARARAPAPAVADVGPATVVERREAPRVVVDPGPAPRVDPRPVAAAVRRPARRHARRIPDLAVLRHAAPAAVFVEVGIADRVGRDVVARNRARVARVTRVDPAVEIVAARQVQHFVITQRAVVEAIGAAGLHAVARVVLAVDVAATLEHRDHRRLALRVDVDAVAAGTVHDERERRRVDLVALAAGQAEHAQVHHAFGEFELGEVVVEVQQREGAALVETDRRRADVHFGARVAIGVEAVAGDERAVQRDFGPAVVAGRLEADLSAQVTDARDATRRVRQGSARARREAEHEQHGHGLPGSRQQGMDGHRCSPVPTPEPVTVGSLPCASPPGLTGGTISVQRG